MNESAAAMHTKLAMFYCVILNLRFIKCRCWNNVQITFVLPRLCSYFSSIVWILSVHVVIIIVLIETVSM